MQASTAGLTPLPAPSLPPHLAAGSHDVKRQGSLPGVQMDPWGFRNMHVRICGAARTDMAVHLAKPTAELGLSLRHARGSHQGFGSPTSCSIL